MAKQKKTASDNVVVHIPREQWFLLRQVSLARSMKQGGRVSVGSILADLVERHRKQLERELY